MEIYLIFIIGFGIAYWSNIVYINNDRCDSKYNGTHLIVESNICQKIVLYRRFWANRFNIVEE